MATDFLNTGSKKRQEFYRPPAEGSRGYGVTLADETAGHLATILKDDKNIERDAFDLNMTGFSYSQEEYKKIENTRNNQRKQEIVAAVVGSKLPDEKKIEAIRSITPQKEDYFVEIFKQNIKEPTFGNILAKNALEEERQLEYAVAKTVADLPDSPVKAVWDIAKMVFPVYNVFEYNLSKYRMAKELETLELLPKNSVTLKNLVLTGDINAIIRKQFNKLSFEEKKKYIETLKEVSKEYSGLIGRNNVLHWENMSDILRNDPEGKDWGRIIENAGGLFSAVFAGAGTRVLLKDAKHLGKEGSAFRALFKSDKKEAAVVAFKVLNGDKKLGKAMGLSAQDVLDAELPRNFTDKVNLTHQATAYLQQAEFKKSSQLVQEALEESRAAAFFEQGVDKELFDPLTAYISDGIIPSMSPTKAYTETGDAIVDATFGRRVVDGEHEGFFTKAGAEQRAEQLGLTKFEIVEAGDKFLIKSEIVSERSAVHHVGNLFDTVNLKHGSGHIAKYFGPQSFFKDDGLEFLKGMAVDAGQEAKIVNEFGRILKPFDSLSTSKKKNVIRAIEKGSNYVKGDGSFGKNFTAEELLDKEFNFSPDMVLGYRAYQNSQRVVKDIYNTTVRRHLIDADLKYVTGGGMDTFARRVNDPAKHVKNGFINVFNPATNKIMPVKAKDIQAIMDEEGFAAGIGQLRKPIKIEAQDGVTDVADYILVGNAFDNSFNAIPDNIIRDVEGYVTRFYDQKWFIDKEKIVKYRGKEDVEELDKVSTVEAINSEGAARIRAEELNAANDGFVYKYRQAREINNRMNVGKHIDFLENSGSIITSRRLPRPLAGSTLVDPIEALERTIMIAAKKGSWDTYLEGMKKRFVNTFKDVTGSEEFPVSKEMLIHSDRVSVQHVEDAKLFWDHIDYMSGVKDPAYQFTQKALVRASKIVGGNSANPFRQFLEGKVLQASDINYINTVKAANYAINIASYPTRQLLIQAGQPLMLTAIDPIVTGKMIKDGPAFVAGMAVRESPKVFNMIAPKAAAVMGMDVKQYTKLIDAYFETGIPYKIKRFDFTADLEQNAIESLTLSSRVLNMMKAPFRAMRYGFMAGEAANMSTTFMFAFHRTMKKTGKSVDDIVGDRKLMESIVYDTNNLSFAMNQESRSALQTGALGLISQYRAIQLRTIMAMAPARVGGATTFTGGEKARIAAACVMLYGSGAVGAGYTLDRKLKEYDISISQEIREILTRGLADWLVNRTISVATGEDVDIRVGESFSPLTGIDRNIQTMVGEGVIGGEVPIWEVALGATATNIHKVGQIYDTASTMYRMKDMTQPENIGNMLDTLLRVLPIWSNYRDAELLAREVDGMVTTYGDHISKLKWAEIKAKQLVGFRANKPIIYWDTVKDSAEYGKKIKKLSNGLHKSLFKMVSIADKPESGHELKAKAIETYLNDMSNLLSVIPAADREAVKLSLQSQLSRSGDSRNLSLYIAESILDGKQGDSLERMNYLLNNLIELGDEENLKIVEAVKDLMGDK